jgi:hypothetical protein
MIKPHLFLPFGVVPLAWIVVTRSYKVLAGTVVALAASCALVYLVDPTAFSQYLQMIRTVGVEAEFIPCLNIVPRFSARGDLNDPGPSSSGAHTLGMVNENYLLLRSHIHRL